MSDIAPRLLDWFATSGRSDLPWQRDPGPYRVWVSEIMLQQTQVATVMPYFTRFVESFPDVNALADADEDAVLEHWSGLGYYARARNLHRAARMVRDDHGGVFPESFDDLIALPGIGRSTAGAVLALSRGQRHPILDGNVKRVLARHYAVDGWPGKSEVAKQLWEHAERNTPEADVAAYTQAIMDLGATVCVRSNPDCEVCPLTAGCAARRDGTQADYPGRKPKRDKPLKKTRMLLAFCDGTLYLEKRPPDGIWGSLWSLPELAEGHSVEDWCRETLNAAPSATDAWLPLRHSFTHFDLDIEPVVVRLDEGSRTVGEGPGRWHELASAPRFGVAAPVMTLIDKLSHLELGVRPLTRELGV